MKATPSDVFMQGGRGNISDAASHMRISVVTVHREVRRGTLTVSTRFGSEAHLSRAF